MIGYGRVFMLSIGHQKILETFLLYITKDSSDVQKWRFSPFPRIRIFISRWFGKAKRRWRYHRVISEEKCEVEENIKRRKNKSKRRKYHICVI